MPEPNINPELFKPVRTENNKAELYVDGPACIDMLLREIKKAEHFINIQIMLFYSDEAGIKVAKALADKAREGVDVRIMSDSDMSRISRGLEKYRSAGQSDFSDLKEIFSEAGIKFIASDKEAYEESYWHKKRQQLKEKGVPEEFLLQQDAVQEGITTNANTLDHRKVLVFDGRSAIVTGMNIGNKYLYSHFESSTDNTKGDHWHDGAVLIKGPCVIELNKSFASKWMVRGGDIFDYKEHYDDDQYYGTDSCTIYSTFPGMKQNHIRNYYLDKIKTCTGKLIIENPYINDKLFWKELTKLKKEQAEKIIIINPYKAKGNDFFQNESSIKCRMWQPLKNGTAFYSYRHRMTHWKIALDVDKQEVFFGSYNLNLRSALHDFELNILVESKEFSQTVKEMLEEDMSKSVQINKADEFFKIPKLHPSCLLLNFTGYFE